MSSVRSLWTLSGSQPRHEMAAQLGSRLRHAPCAVFVRAWQANVKRDPDGYKDEFMLQVSSSTEGAAGSVTCTLWAHPIRVSIGRAHMQKLSMHCPHAVPPLPGAAGPVQAQAQQGVQGVWRPGDVHGAGEQAGRGPFTSPTPPSGVPSCCCKHQVALSCCDTLQPQLGGMNLLLGLFC